MRVITPEEYDYLHSACEVIYSADDATDASPEEQVVWERLSGRGLVAEVPVDDAIIYQTTHLGKLAMQCYLLVTVQVME